MRQELTIHDIAREAGVSAATVSRVLTGSAGVRAEKADRVREVVARLGYRPNPFARSLLGLGTRAIGVLVPQLEDGFYGKVLTGVERQLREAGFSMLCSLGHNLQGLEQEALDLFAERQVDGLILFADHLPEAKLLELSAAVPLVLINRSAPELAGHCVRLNNHRGGYLATRHLLDLGHTRVAHLTGPLNRQGARERYDGYRDALREAGIEADERLVVETDFSEASGQAGVERLLKRTHFTAVFAASDEVAVGALAALRGAGLEVPGEVSLVGFGDGSAARYTAPALTTMHYPVIELGAKAAERLLDLLRGGRPEEAVVLEPELVRRASSGAAE